MLINKIFLDKNFEEYRKQKCKGEELKKIFNENIENKKLKKFLKNNIYKEVKERKHIVLEEKFYKNFIEEGNEENICKILGCEILSILINGTFKFIHNTDLYNIDSIKRKGLKPANQISELDRDGDGPLGVGIYCYEYNAYIGERGVFTSKPSFSGTYNGDYLKCIYGYPDGCGVEGLREYLLLGTNTSELKLVNKNISTTNL